MHLRVFCFLSIVSSLITFSAIEKSQHPKVDVVITYLLLLGAICLDVYSFIRHASPKWTILLADQGSKVQKWYTMVVTSKMHYSKGKKAMIRSMAQHDLINYYVKAKTNKFTEAVKIIDTGNLLQRHLHTDWKPVDSKLKQFIYSHLKEKVDENRTPKELEEWLNGKGEKVLQERGVDVEDLELYKVDFIQCIFLWHFATELLYYDDGDKFRRGDLGPFCQIANTFSDYMMYLVLVRPLMLPKGLSEVINEHNYNQANNFFTDMRKKVTRKDFIPIRKRFIEATLGYKPFEMKSNTGFEMIGAGSLFAQRLQSLVPEHRWEHEEKWEMISKMMINAASHCSWKEHAQQLRYGGELLTHVALLLAHLGLTTQIHKEEDEFDMPQLPL